MKLHGQNERMEGKERERKEKKKERKKGGQEKERRKEMGVPMLAQRQ